MKAIKFSEKSFELCPFCEEEVELGHSVENCPNCGNVIACCSMCDVISNDSVCVNSLSSCAGCINASNFVLNSLVDKETTEEVDVVLNFTEPIRFEVRNDLNHVLLDTKSLNKASDSQHKISNTKVVAIDLNGIEKVLN